MTSLIPTTRQIKEAQLHRRAVIQLARMAAKNVVKERMRNEGRRMTLVPPAEITAKAVEYLDAHPELYEQAKERANSIGYVDPFANISSDAQRTAR